MGLAKLTEVLLSAASQPGRHQLKLPESVRNVFQLLQDDFPNKLRFRGPFEMRMPYLADGSVDQKVGVKINQK